jgi:hypothetical protein
MSAAVRRLAPLAAVSALLAFARIAAAAKDPPTLQRRPPIPWRVMLAVKAEDRAERALSEGRMIMRDIGRNQLSWPERAPHGALPPTSASQHTRIV